MGFTPSRSMGSASGGSGSAQRVEERSAALPPRQALQEPCSRIAPAACRQARDAARRAGGTTLRPNEPFGARVQVLPSQGALPAAGDEATCIQGGCAAAAVTGCSWRARPGSVRAREVAAGAEAPAKTAEVERVPQEGCAAQVVGQVRRHLHIWGPKGPSLGSADGACGHGEQEATPSEASAEEVVAGGDAEATPVVRAAAAAAIRLTGGAYAALHAERQALATARERIRELETRIHELSLAERAECRRARALAHVGGRRDMLVGPRGSDAGRPAAATSETTTQTAAAAALDVGVQTAPACARQAETQTVCGESAAVAVQTEESEPGRAPEARVSVVEATGVAGTPSKAPGSREATRVEAELAVRRQVVVTPARTGGRQRRKAQLRRQAAAAGVDVWDWEDVRSQLTIALARRLDCAQEKGSRERSGQQGDATGAEERFRQAAWATGVTIEVE